MNPVDAFNRLPDRLQDAWRAVGQKWGWNFTLRLAVSGGPDSLAMLIGFAALRGLKISGNPLEVVSVDHGLRPESADEAKRVAGLCKALEIDCRIATLTPPANVKNKQAWARAARYKALIGDQPGCPPIFTAHTADDQAETLLMRAARGTGSEGLAAIRAQMDFDGAMICRPFLSWPKDDLHAILAGTPWVPAHDRSNDDETSTRVRFRNWLKNPPVPDSDRSVAMGFAQTAQIAALESDALNQIAQQNFMAMAWRNAGFVQGSLDWAGLAVAIQARVLRLCLSLVARDHAGSDAQRPFDMARLVALCSRVQREPQGRWVGGGAVLDWDAETEAGASFIRITAFAESGRSGFPTVNVAPGQSVHWDGRFAISNGSDHAVHVRAWQTGDLVPANVEVQLKRDVLKSLPVAVLEEQVIGHVFSAQSADAAASGPVKMRALRQ